MIVIKSNFFILIVFLSFLLSFSIEKKSNAEELIKDRVYLIDTIKIDTLYISNIYSIKKNLLKKSIKKYNICSKFYINKEININSFIKSKQYYSIYIDNRSLKSMLSSIHYDKVNKKQDNLDTFRWHFYKSIAEFSENGLTSQYSPTQFKENNILVGHRYFVFLVKADYLKSQIYGSDTYDFENLRNCYLRVICPIP